MRLLLDSHVVIWAMTWPERLRPVTRAALVSPDNEIFVSAATFWELELKIGKGKLLLPADFHETLQSQDFTELAVKSSHTRGIRSLPAIHGDPFDRLLMSQAIAEGLVFVTADSACLSYPVPLMPA